MAGCRRRAVSTSPQLSLGSQVAGGARNALPARFVRNSGSAADPGPVPSTAAGTGRDSVAIQAQLPLSSRRCLTVDGRVR